MSTSTRTTESRYPSRSRTAPECAPIDANQPVGAIPTDMANVGRLRNNGQQLQHQPRRTPALTTSRTFGEKSPIVNADIQSFLAKCMSMNQWESYTGEEKLMIMGNLPTTRGLQRGMAHVEDPHAEARDNYSLRLNGEAHTSSVEHQEQDRDLYTAPPLEPIFCSEDPYLKRSIARFKRELSDGYYTKVWQDKAKRAHEERMQGEFDQYLAVHAEEMFVEEDDQANEAGAVELAQESDDGEYNDGGSRIGRNAKARCDR